MKVGIPSLNYSGATVEGLLGRGIHSSPYQIKSAQDWNLVISSGAYLSSSLKVMNDIDFSDSNLERVSINRPFSGTLMGTEKPL